MFNIFSDKKEELNKIVAELTKKEQGISYKKSVLENLDKEIERLQNTKKSLKNSIQVLDEKYNRLYGIFKNEEEIIIDEKSVDDEKLKLKDIWNEKRINSLLHQYKASLEFNIDKFYNLYDTLYDSKNLVKNIDYDNYNDFSKSFILVKKVIDVSYANFRQSWMINEKIKLLNTIKQKREEYIRSCIRLKKDDEENEIDELGYLSNLYKAYVDCKMNCGKFYGVDDLVSLGFDMENIQLLLDLKGNWEYVNGDVYLNEDKLDTFGFTEYPYSENIDIQGDHEHAERIIRKMEENEVHKESFYQIYEEMELLEEKLYELYDKKVDDIISDIETYKDYILNKIDKQFPFTKIVGYEKSSLENFDNIIDVLRKKELYSKNLYDELDNFETSKFKIQNISEIYLLLLDVPANRKDEVKEKIFNVKNIEDRVDSLDKIITYYKEIYARQIKDIRDEIDFFSKNQVNNNSLGIWKYFNLYRENKKLKKYIKYYIKNNNNDSFKILTNDINNIEKEELEVLKKLLVQEGIDVTHLDQFILYGLLEYEYEENYESIFSRIKHCKSVKKYIFRYMDIVGISNDQYKDYAYVGGLLYGIFINKIPHYVLGNDIYKEFLFILNDLLPEYKIYAMKKAANEEMNSIENINDKEAVIDIDFDLMSGVEFEEFLGEKFREKGYRVQYTPTTGDQGADLIITKKGIKTVVQAKCYSNPVGNKAVQEVIAAKTFYDANKAMVITNNSFTNAAIELAKGTGVTLWNGEDLKRLYR